MYSYSYWMYDYESGLRNCLVSPAPFRIVHTLKSEIRTPAPYRMYLHSSRPQHSYCSYLSGAKRTNTNSRIRIDVSPPISNRIIHTTEHRIQRLRRIVCPSSATNTYCSHPTHLPQYDRIHESVMIRRFLYCSHLTLHPVLTFAFTKYTVVMRGKPSYCVQAGRITKDTVVI